jgi:hypothetical protein
MSLLRFSLINSFYQLFWLYGIPIYPISYVSAPFAWSIYPHSNLEHYLICFEPYKKIWSKSMLTEKSDGSNAITSLVEIIELGIKRFSSRLENDVSLLYTWNILGHNYLWKRKSYLFQIHT